MICAPCRARDALPGIYCAICGRGPILEGPPADPGLVTVRALLERVAAMHPDPCDDPACPMPEVRAFLRGAS